MSKLDEDRCTKLIAMMTSDNLTERGNAAFMLANEITKAGLHPTEVRLISKKDEPSGEFFMRLWEEQKEINKRYRTWVTQLFEKTFRTRDLPTFNLDFKQDLATWRSLIGPSLTIRTHKRLNPNDADVYAIVDPSTQQCFFHHLRLEEIEWFAKVHKHFAQQWWFAERMRKWDVSEEERDDA